MENLLPCPECGGQPKLSSLEPEYQNMKYFCGVHVACGDWKKTEALAAVDWNKRVQEYKDALQRIKTPGTPEFLEIQGNLKAYVCCEDCGYMTDTMTMKDLIFKLSMDGGYIVSDKNGGYFSQCPKCGSEKLSLETT
ncbi:hypothetical protein Desaci_4122 [Desulfosporosinus acidiphilus SJ4]|uniref:Uncharacterized protein n=1 Tax=Desulfosporosinus acidiphilus (strain DSM 22704 / JCM 16185 / SJ4) TaxID=646529 RepID=I4DB10_DESAJ|nr:hypothetical protein [Desulfosporosinus acidiphilus]AFM42984.1 hypothetical protein Desaci_4122 [Desulfosporosinus acidiphilus SJ4]